MVTEAITVIWKFGKHLPRNGRVDFPLYQSLRRPLKQWCIRLNIIQLDVDTDWSFSSLERQAGGYFGGQKGMTDSKV